MTRSESIPRTEFQLATSSTVDPAFGIGNFESTRQLSNVSRPLLRWFAWYSRRYVRRHFHSLRVSLKGLPPETRELPLVIYSNHASWWDALICLVLKEQFFPCRTAFAPIDAAMLARYKFFQRLGFFGVEQHSRRGAFQFLRTAEAVLRSPRNLLAITPQGRFVDVRELLVRFGEPVVIQTQQRSAFAAKYWTKLFEDKLTDTQVALAAEAQRRNPADFQVVLRGGAGQGGLYDLWSSFKSKWRGEIFRKEHGDK
jgi:hypothetical protein